MEYIRRLEVTPAWSGGGRRCVYNYSKAQNAFVLFAVHHLLRGSGRSTVLTATGFVSANQ